MAAGTRSGRSEYRGSTSPCPRGTRRAKVHSARLLPCARSSSEQVVEGTHHIIAEGTGLEPYSPCQGLVRGQGGLEDVQACVDLPVHLPVAHQTHEHLAHPISAPGATHWAGLTGPRGVHFDDWHTFEGGFVLDLTMDHRTRPGGEAAVHPTGTASRTVECEVLQDNRGPRLGRESHEALGDPMEPLADALPFPPTLAVEEPSSDPPIEGLLAGESPSAPKVDRLDATHAAQRHAEEPRRIAPRTNPSEGIFVRVAA